MSKPVPEPQNATSLTTRATSLLSAGILVATLLVGIAITPTTGASTSDNNVTFTLTADSIARDPGQAVAFTASTVRTMVLTVASDATGPPLAVGCGAAVECIATVAFKPQVGGALDLLAAASVSAPSGWTADTTGNGIVYTAADVTDHIGPGGTGVFTFTLSSVEDTGDEDQLWQASASKTDGAFTDSVVTGYELDIATITIPTVANVLASSGNAGFGIVGDTLTLTATPSEAGTFSAASIAGVDVLGSIQDNGDGSFSFTHVLTGAEPAGPAAVSVSFSDLVGNAVTSADGSDDVVLDFTAPTLTSVQFYGSGGPGDAEAAVSETVTVAFTGSEDIVATGATIGGLPATIAGNTATLEIDGSFAEGALAFTLDYADLAGNDGATATATTDASGVTVNFGDLVESTIAVTDGFLETGDSASVTATVVWGPDEALTGPWLGEVEFLVDGVVVATGTTDGNGVATFDDSQSDVGTYTYTVRAIESFGNPDQAVSDVGASRSTDVVFTQLAVGGLSVADDVLGLGEDAALSLDLVWAHDDSPAANLDATALLAQVEGQDAGADPLGLIGSTGLGTTSGFGTSATGTYATAFGLLHGDYESLAFTGLQGSANEGAGATLTTFNAPALDPEDALYVHWVGATVKSLEASLAGDDSPTFVNLDDTVALAATVIYTPNYDPAQPNGVSSGDAEALVEGATVGLFELGNLDALNTIDDNLDATLTSVTGADGVATFTVSKATFSQALTRDGANTYDLQAFAIAVPDIPDQDNGARGDLATEADQTFTALDLAVTGQTGVEDIDGARWWLDMDNAKGATDTDPSDGDALDVDVVVTWRHDGSLVDSADVKVHDGANYLANGGDDFVTVTDANGEATVTIDPDTFGLDALVQSLEFEATSAPEPNEMGGTITQSVTTVTQEALWSRIAVAIAYATGSDGEVDLAQDVGLTLQPVYYHTEDNNVEGGYYLGDGTAAQAVDDLDFTANVADTSPAGLTTLASGASAGFTSGVDTLPVLLTVRGGCADPDEAVVPCTPDLTEAGYHTYVASPEGVFTAAPHALSVDGSEIDVLYTAVVLDTSTDLLTAEVGDAITVSGQAYYAHTTDAAGDDVGNLPYTAGALVDVLDDATTVADDLALDEDGALGVVIPAATAAGHHDLKVAAVSLDDDGSASPLTLVYDGPTMERVWLELSIAGVSAERSLQIRGRDVDVQFTLSYTDGVATETVDLVDDAFDFSTLDDNAADRFDAVQTAGAPALPATAVVTGPGLAELFPAAYDGGCGCWLATLTGYDAVANNLAFDVAATAPVTDETTLADELLNEFTVTFSAITLDVIEAGNPAYQGDLGEFWYNLATPGTFTVEAAWQHAGTPPAIGVTFDVEDLGILGDLAGVVVVDNLDGSYDVSVPSPVASANVPYTLGVTGVDSPVAEAAFTDAAPFLLDGASLVDDLTVADLVHTRVQFDWTGSFDGTFVNRNQAAVLDFVTAWEHDLSKVDRAHGWALELGATDALAGVSPSGLLSSGRFDVTRTTSGPVLLSASIAEIPNVVAAPRGINSEVYLDLVTPTVTWTALAMDVSAPSTAPAGSTVTVLGRAALEHAPATHVSGASIKLAGTGQTTAADGFGPGVPGASVGLRVLSPGSVTVFAEGVSFVPGTVLGGTAITASSDDSQSITFT